MLAFAACFWVEDRAAPHPLVAATAAYYAVLAGTRLRPRVHFEHCRFWTCLAVGTALTLGSGPWLALLALALLRVCPEWMLWWPKEARAKEQRGEAGASSSRGPAPSGASSSTAPAPRAQEERPLASRGVVVRLRDETKAWQKKFRGGEPKQLPSQRASANDRERKLGRTWSDMKNKYRLAPEDLALL